MSTLKSELSGRSHRPSEVNAKQQSSLAQKATDLIQTYELQSAALTFQTLDDKLSD
jgi:hypothetical protein